MRHMVPDHVWKIAAPYGLAPEPGERADPSDARDDGDAAGRQ
jgi:coenzyme F420 hydrogenase subunit beta